MRTHTIVIYSFDELSEAAKKKALEHHRNYEVEDSNWWDWTYDSFIDNASLKGYSVLPKDIQFDLSQGACFSGTVRKTHEQTLALLPCDLVAKINLINAKLRLLGDGPRITDLECQFWLNYSNNYRRSKTMSISSVSFIFGEWTRCNRNTCTCFPEWPSLCDELEALWESINDAIYGPVEKAVLEEARGLADELHKSLEKEHEYLTSDEHLSEMFRSNDKEFTEDGKPF
jgi:hypothetical protein